MTLVQRYPRLSVFLSLQVIDFSTTYLALHFGAHEQNPLVVMLINFYGLAISLVLLKCFGGLLALKLGETNKSLYRANWIYGVVMCWNVCALTWHMMQPESVALLRNLA